MAEAGSYTVRDSATGAPSQRLYGPNGREVEAVTNYLQELEQIGCVFKGFEQGLVDFYGKLDGRDIFWCWKHGEEKIEHWHELEAGYQGRQPVPEVVRG